MKYTHNEWIQKAIDKYGNRFSYDETHYIDSYHKVKIFCNEHNRSFEVDPISFIRKDRKGNHCPECKHNKKLTHDEFIEKANKIWGHVYNFDKSKYITSRDNVIVTCPDHGDFIIQARHITSRPMRVLCPTCISETEHHEFDLVKHYTNNPTKGGEDGVFYRVLVKHKLSGIEFLKIGVTSLTTYQRYNYNSYNDFDFDILDEIYDTMLNVSIFEKEYKHNNKLKRFYIPNDIQFKGRTECYIIDSDIQLKSKQIKFIRDSILSKQNGMCAICGKIPEMPTLDHYHSSKHNGSGLVRGVLCNQCNRFVGVIENNALRNNICFSDIPSILRRLSDYVYESRYPYIHPNEAPKPDIVTKKSFNTLIKTMIESGYKKKLPVYRIVKNKNKQKLTVPLKKLFDKFGVQPEYYKN